MRHGCPAICTVVLLGLTFGHHAVGAIDVLEPNGSGVETLAEGEEFSLYVKGNRWDMSGPEDIIGPLSGDLTRETFDNGIYRAVSVESAGSPGSGRSDAKFYLTFQGYQDSMYSLESGQRFPVDTSRFDRITLKIRHLSESGQPLGTRHPVFIYFFKDESPIAAGFSGVTDSKNVMSDGDWHIVSWDMNRDIGANSNWRWTDFSQVKGLRVDPTNQAGVQVEIDWIRLSASGSPRNQFEVVWNGGSPPFTISARKSGEPDAVLATGVESSPATVDLDLLPPGNYRIAVSDGRESGESAAALNINDAPLVVITQPDRLGDTDNSYAKVEAGNPWGPMDSDDVSLTAGMKLISYNNPPGTMTATTTSTDSRIVLNTPVPIDTSRYRMLSFRLSVSGIGPNQPFAISRVFWGDTLDTSLNTSEDLVIREGLNTYAIGDMRDVPLERHLPSAWTGSPRYFRFDAHELTGNQFMRLDHITLAPLDTANPLFDITWEDADSDDNASISLYADVDKVPGNGNETRIASGLQEDSATDRFTWNAPSDVADGEYWIYAVASDGLNEVVRYADGPIAVGDSAPPPPDEVDPPPVRTDKLFNLSTRADEELSGPLAGFIIRGDTKKCVVLRGRGQSMSLSDSIPKLQNPTLRLKQGLTTVDYNDDWRSHPSSSVVQSLGMAPAFSSESAIYICLMPGRYIALLERAPGTAPGIGIVEVFDVDDGSAYLYNISTRARVGPGASVMSAGFIVRGDTPRTMLVRARGPSVKVDDTLPDPHLTLRQSANILRENDNWRDASNWQEIVATGAAPEAAADAAILMTLAPGAYTAQVRAADGQYGGMAIVEVIDVTP